jgi:tetratricopeptide (TPR) repeat protein
MHKIFATVILGAMLAAGQNQAQTQPTAAELLQKGIYAQETAGDLDGAIKIYHQIVDSHQAQREIAAQAQYRLGTTLLEKGDAAAASQEIQRLGWDFPDYKDLIASAKNASGATIRVPITFYSSLKEAEDLAKLTALKANHDAEFDFTKSTTVTGTVTQIQMMNPNAWLTLALATPMRVSLASPDALAAGGWNKGTVKLGDQVTVTGAPALDGSSTMQATSVSANGAVLFTRSK